MLFTESPPAVPGVPGVPGVPVIPPGPPVVPKGPDGKPEKGPDGKVVTPTGPDGKPEGNKDPEGNPTPPDAGMFLSYNLLFWKFMVKAFVNWTFVTINTF